MIADSPLGTTRPGKIQNFIFLIQKEFLAACGCTSLPAFYLPVLTERVSLWQCLMQT